MSLLSFRTLNIFSLSLIIASSFYSKVGYCQFSGGNNLSFIECTGVVQLKDSEYLLIPKLIVKSSKEKITLNKVVSYDQGINCYLASKINYKDSFCPAYFYLEKLMGNTYANISVNVLREPKCCDLDVFEFRMYGINDHLTDTIRLQNYYPLEVGKYRIRLEISYFYKKQPYLANSDWLEFVVPYPSPHSIFF